MEPNHKKSLRPIVLVTGASGVLGGALARHLERNGFEIRAHGFRNRPDFAHTFQADLRDEIAVEQLFWWARPHLVIHCAGFSRDNLLLKTSIDSWHETLEGNALSSFIVVREALRVLPDGGQIILLSSRVGARGFVGQSAYAASKGAILGLVKSAASEGKSRQIAVNGVFPGFAESALSSNLKPEILRLRKAENLISQSDAAFSLSHFCTFLLNCSPAPSGQIFSPDCRI